MRNKFLGTGAPGYHPLRKIAICLSGLRYAVLYDFTVAYKVVLSTVLLLAAFVLRQWIDFVMILVATGLVLTAELLNSAIEAVCDFMETRENEKIRVIKDIAAAAVGISMLVWVVVFVTECLRLWPLLFHEAR